MKKLVVAMIVIAMVVPGCVGLQVGLSEKGLTVNLSAVTPESIQKKIGVEIVDD
ncbi:MAG: hypothetical protein JEZ12_24870 [Desulfobacterium sp.]|nr:hypothetical protein [Desulfobacterium sp.]